MAEASGCHNQRSEFEPAPYHEERESWHFCMKIYRLIGIITTLQQQKTVTAPYLAEKFEVSRRTINRDIEDICRAGIPLVTTQGAGGGISIMEGFSLDTTVFTKQELAAILTGLKSLDSISRSAAIIMKRGRRTSSSSPARSCSNGMTGMSSDSADSTGIFGCISCAACGAWRLLGRLLPPGRFRRRRGISAPI